MLWLEEHKKMFIYNLLFKLNNEHENPLWKQFNVNLILKIWDKYLLILCFHLLIMSLRLSLVASWTKKYIQNCVRLLIFFTFFSLFFHGICVPFLCTLSCHYHLTYLIKFSLKICSRFYFYVVHRTKMKAIALIL